MTAHDDNIVRAIANELDGRERWILLYLDRHITLPYRDVGGDTLNMLAARGLVRVTESQQPRSCWPVVCSELGLNVATYLRTHKTVTRGHQP